MPVAAELPELPELPDRSRIPGAPRSSGGVPYAGTSHDRRPPDGRPYAGSSGFRQSRGGAPRVAALDGLRGVAIAAVVAFHVGVLPGGFLGVDLFFVLSGYLITGLLLAEQQATGNIALRQFWTRRARRLVPAVLFLVAVVQLWARTKAMPAELPVINGQSAAAMAYGSNWFNILFDVGYWSVGPGNSPLNHLWSLAIEEQFYILFPLVLFVVLVVGKLRPTLVVWMALVLAASSFVLTPFVFAILGANRAYFGTDTRVGAILLGGALAAWFHTRSAAARDTRAQSNAQGSAQSNVLSNAPTSAQSGSAQSSTQIGAPLNTAPTISSRALSAVTIAAAASVAVMVALWTAMTTSSPMLYRGGLALHALASASIIAATVLAPVGVFARLLQWRPIVWIGERSYSLYLWHWPLIVLLPRELTTLHGPMLLTVVALAITIATLVSYELIEQPIRYSGLTGRRLVAALSIPAALITGSAFLLQPQPSPQFGSDMLITQGRSGIRLMLVGDSWARKLGIALATVDSSHRLSILNMGKGGCGITDAQRQRTAEKGVFETAYDCLQWRTIWRTTIESVRPEVAILNVGNWDQAPQDFNGTGEFVGACSALFAERYAQQLDSAVSILGQRGAHVFVMTIRDNDARAGSGPDCLNALLRAAVTRHASQGVRLLDLYAQLCQNHRCPDIADGEAVYDGTGHLAPTAQQRIATWVLNSVNASLSVP